MKKFRKFTAMVTAIALAGCMMTSMSMLNVSAEANNSITITTATTDEGTHTYEAYQIFAGTYDDDANSLNDITWGTGIDKNKLKDLNLSGIKVKGKNDDEEEIDIAIFNGVDLNNAKAVAQVLGQYATPDDNDVAKQFASAISSCLSDTATATSTVDSESGTITISGLADGYYLVQDDDSSPTDSGDNNSGAKTRYILEVVGGQNVAVTSKSSAPSVMKKVQENTKYTDTETKDSRIDTTLNTTDDKGWNDVADYGIGDTVPFRLYGTMPSTLDDYTTYYYEFQDTLGKEFTVVDGEDEDTNVDVVVKLFKDESGNVTEYDNGTVINADNYELSQTTDVTSQVTKINIKFDNVKTIPNLTKDSIITVEYKATLNSSAAIGIPGQENAVKLIYSNNPNQTGEEIPETGETPDDKVIVFTYELDLTKVNGAAWNAYQDGLRDGTIQDTVKFKDYKGYTEKYLKNAEFKLSKTVGTETQYVQIDDETGKVTGWTTDYTQASVLKTDDDGKIKIIGLDDGKYSLEETKAPDGYNKLNTAIELTLKATTANNQEWDGTANKALTNIELTTNDTTNSATEKGDVNTGMVNAIISNNSGTQLPSTGGIGTTIFYTVGGVLVVGAGVTLIAKKRAKNEQ